MGPSTMAAVRGYEVTHACRVGEEANEFPRTELREKARERTRGRSIDVRGKIKAGSKAEGLKSGH